MIGDAVKRYVGDAMRQVRLAFRAVGSATKASETRRIRLVDGEGLAGEQLKSVELFQQFGFTSALPAGTQLVVLPLGGRTSHAVVIATENAAYRLEVKESGEVALYNQWGDYVWLKKEGQMVLKAATSVEIDTPLAHFTGSVVVAEAVTVGVDVVAAGISLVDHVHDEQGDFSPTSAPR
ncbi:MAG: phage baseplate assembly protein V [Ramlibacter sp.]